MFKNFEEALQYLQSFVHNKPNLRGRSGLIRMTKVLEVLGNPQNQYQVIHIAGTSGKTSTAIATARLLESQGLKVGLTYSPYLLTILEEFQINNQNLSPDRFVVYVSEIQAVLEDFRHTADGHLNYIEVLSILIAYAFAKQKVQVAVVEGRVGGLYDNMNVFNPDNKICVITDVGLDHQDILGSTISEIAYQKAGIIQPHNEVLTLEQSPKVRAIINRVVGENLAEVSYLKRSNNFKIISKGSQDLAFDYKFKNYNLQGVKTKIKGRFQVRNLTLALAATQSLIQSKKLQFNVPKVLSVLESLDIPGRFQQFSIGGRQVILDGAHNPQKASNLIKSLQEYLPDSKFVFLIAIKESKEYSVMVNQFAKVAKRIIFCEFAVSDKFLINSISSQILSDCLPEKSISIGPITKPKIEESTNSLLDGEVLVITGSLYLVGQVYLWLEELEEEMD